MPVTTEDVLRALRPDEPRYSTAARRLGDEAAPVLSELVRGADVEFAAKAASLAGFLSADAALPVLAQALAHADPAVRIAAAAALGRQPDLAADLTGQLLRDRDVGVRKWTLRSLATTQPPGLRSHVERLAAEEPVPAVRDLAGQVVDRLPE